MHDTLRKAISATEHTLAACPQNPVLVEVRNTLARLDRNGERTAIALEHIAAQGAMVAAHEKRHDKHDIDLRILFNRVNDESRFDKVDVAIQDIAARVIHIEKRQAKEDGADEIEVKSEAKVEAEKLEARKLRTELKLRLIGPFTYALFFSIWLIDKLGIAGKVAKLWHEFNGA